MQSVCNIIFDHEVVGQFNICHKVFFLFERSGLRGSTFSKKRIASLISYIPQKENISFKLHQNNIRFYLKEVLTFII